MSLFDVIKYPISDPPTRQELEALPDDLFQKCAVELFGKKARQFLSAYGLALNLDIYKKNYNSEYHICMSTLKRIIKEYNEPI